MKKFTIEEIQALIGAQRTALQGEEEPVFAADMEELLSDDFELLLKHPNRRSLDNVSYTLLMYSTAFSRMLDILGTGTDDDVACVHSAFTRSYLAYADEDLGISYEEAVKFVNTILWQSRQAFETWLAKREIDQVTTGIKS